MTNPYRVRNSTRDLGTWPSREEILALGAELDERYNVDHGDVVLVRAALARWGTPAIQPVPVSERPILKSSSFNNADGHCWCGTSDFIDEHGDSHVSYPASWELREPCSQDDCVLPHHALPVPEDCEENKG